MTIDLRLGDCLEVMAGMPENSVDSVITDPPYGLEFMGKGWDAPWKGKASKAFSDIKPGTLGGFRHLPQHHRSNNIKCENCGKWKFSSNPCACSSPRFPNTRQMAMVKYQEWCTQWAGAALRVAKPGAILMAFGGTRTHHRLMVAIEDAGWVIRDTIMWVYGSGFPKSLDIGKSLDRREQNRWQKICKATDSVDVYGIIELWKEYSRSASSVEVTFPTMPEREYDLTADESFVHSHVPTKDNHVPSQSNIQNDLGNAKSAGLQFAKSTIETGTSTEGRDFVLGPVLLSINLEKSSAHAIIAELSLHEAHLMSGVDMSSAQHNVEVITERLNELARYADKSSEGPRANADMPTFTVLCGVKDWPSESMVDKLKGAEALKIWLGSKKSLREETTSALCAALTDDLKHIMLSRSKTFLNLDTIQQMDFVSATSVTITESIAECLITFTADTLRNKALDKAAGAEREVVGQRSTHLERPITNQWKLSAQRHNGNPFHAPSGQTCPITAPATPAARTWDGWGTALKPAWEPIILAMAPLDGTFAHNAEKWGVAGLWIDGCRVPANDNVTRDRDTSDGASIFGTGKGGGAVVPVASGRFPANLIHDGSDEVVGLFPGNAAGSHKQEPTHSINAAFGGGRYDNSSCYGDSGSAARFFKTCPQDAKRLYYCSKASRRERNAGCEGLEEREAPKQGGAPIGRQTSIEKRGGNIRMSNGHPTVKPLALMEYLCKLTRTPTGGVVLDPFAGSGTTGCACVNTDRDFIGIEIDADYFAIAEARIAHAQAQPAQMQMEDMA